MNYSEDSRINDFCRELALALRRITGLTPDSLPGDLPKQEESLTFPDEKKDDDEEDDDEEDNDDED
jgi:hypothetical protein